MPRAIHPKPYSCNDSALHDNIFAGCPREATNVLRKVVQKKSQFSEYINHVVNVVSGSEEGVIRRNDILPYHPFDDEVPDSFSGYCYCLVSLRDRQSTYIGQTMNLRKRLHRHNEGIGGVKTSDPALRPWAVMAHVCSFEGHRMDMLNFEFAWKKKEIIEGHILQMMWPV